MVMMTLILYMVFSIPLFVVNLSVSMNQLVYLLAYMIFFIKNFFCGFSKISYCFGIDSFSYGLIIMSLMISSLVIISMVNSYFFSYFNLVNLILMIFLYIIFSTLNFLYMYISFEFVLLPLIILILGWGYQPERLMAGMYLFFYTVLVSMPLFILILYVFFSFHYLFFDLIILSSSFTLIHFILVFVFLVKLPMFLVHFWLPKAHVQAPVSGSMILAALMLKIGGYGLIRVVWMWEDLFLNYSFVWFSFALVGSSMISMLCLVQGDMKCLIAFSSVSHMGMVIMGLMTMTKMGLIGSFFLMIGHGFCSSGLFYVSNLYYNRTGSRSFYISSGLLSYIPSCSLMFFILCSFNMSCPPSLNFISELMILSSMIMYWFSSIYYFLLISFFCACFSYYLYSFSQHGLYHNLYSFSPMTVLEYFCVIIHIVPLVLLPICSMVMFF